MILKLLNGTPLIKQPRGLLIRVDISKPQPSYTCNNPRGLTITRVTDYWPMTKWRDPPSIPCNPQAFSGLRCHPEVLKVNLSSPERGVRMAKGASGEATKLDGFISSCKLACRHDDCINFWVPTLTLHSPEKSRKQTLVARPTFSLKSLRLSVFGQFQAFPILDIPSYS